MIHETLCVDIVTFYALARNGTQQELVLETHACKRSKRQMIQMI